MVVAPDRAEILLGAMAYFEACLQPFPPPRPRNVCAVPCWCVLSLRIVILAEMTSLFTRPGRLFLYAQVGRVVMLWTVARVVWGLSALTAVVEFQRLVGSASSFREQVDPEKGACRGRHE